MQTLALDSHTTRAATASFRLAMRKTGEARRQAIAEHFKRFPGPVGRTCAVKQTRRMSI